MYACQGACTDPRCFPTPNPQPVQAPEKEEGRLCRICFDGEEEEGNALVSPCKCIG